MDKFLKKIKSTEGIGIIFLTILVIFAGYMVYFQKDFKVKTSNKTNSSKSFSGYYFGDDYYNYDYITDDYDYSDSYSSSYTSSGYYNDNYSSSSYYGSNYSYSSTPSIKYSTSRIINQYGYFDPMENVESSNGNVEVIYNNVNTKVVGNYTVVYRVCTNSNNCKTVTTAVTVRNKNNINDKYSKGPIWSNTNSRTCNLGSSSCKTSNVPKPTAKDPVTNKTLNVSLINGSVNINRAGTYVLVYYAETKNGVSGTISKIVNINGNSSNNNYDDYYNDNYYNDNYYNDDYYYNYDNNYNNNYNDDYYYTNNNTKKEKYLSNYEWENTVGYLYRCDNVGESGVAGWSLVSTDISNGLTDENADNHPTYNYSNGTYFGTLNKVDFYCKKGCSKNLVAELGVCQNAGETKRIYTTWVGVYAGYVYTN